jgi:hypothetical protein
MHSAARNLQEVHDASQRVRYSSGQRSGHRPLLHHRRVQRQLPDQPPERLVLPRPTLQKAIRPIRRHENRGPVLLHRLHAVVEQVLQHDPPHGRGDALYASVLFPLRIGHPPLRIPWDEIQFARTKFFFRSYIALTLGNQERILMRVPLRMARNLGILDRCPE